jgi:SAM-dependent methyltransferase
MIRRLASRPPLLAPAFAAMALCACQPAGNEAGNEAGNAACSTSPIAQTKEELVSSEYAVVRGMLDLAQVTGDDLVADLGSGDGRIPILAAKEKGARGLGIEIDRARLRQSAANAKAAGVSDRVTFRQQDLFVTPLNDVTVLTLYLLPEINLTLRPKILEQMRPGSRVVSNTFDMGDWRPDERRTIGGTNIFMWVVPAKVEGRWRITQGGAAGELALRQNYQDVSGTAGGGQIAEAQLRGDRIAFTADLGQGRRRFEGRVVGDRMSGQGWQAVRVSGS